MSQVGHSWRGAENVVSKVNMINVVFRQRRCG